MLWNLYQSWREECKDHIKVDGYVYETRIEFDDGVRQLSKHIDARPKSDKATIQIPYFETTNAFFARGRAIFSRRGHGRTTDESTGSNDEYFMNWKTLKPRNIFEFFFFAIPGIPR